MLLHLTHSLISFASVEETTVSEMVSEQRIVDSQILEQNQIIDTIIL